MSETATSYASSGVSPDPSISGGDTPELIRRDFARAWGAIGAAWGVTPSTAAVQGYLLLHGGPLTEAELRDALGLSHRAGQRGPAARAWIPVGDHWEWFRRVAAARKERETDPVLPLLEACELRAEKVTDPRLRERVISLLAFVHQFDQGVAAVVRADSRAIAHLFAVLERLDAKTLDRLMAVIVSIPEDELVKAAATLSGMSPKLVRGFVALANAPGLARLVGAGRG